MVVAAPITGFFLANLLHDTFLAEKQPLPVFPDIPDFNDKRLEKIRENIGTNVTIPNEYRCPITWGIINEPYKLGSNYYEAKALLAHLNSKNTDPCTNLPLEQELINKIKQEINEEKFDNDFAQEILNWLDKLEPDAFNSPQNSLTTCQPKLKLQ